MPSPAEIHKKRQPSKLKQSLARMFPIIPGLHKEYIRQIDPTGEMGKFHEEHPGLIYPGMLGDLAQSAVDLATPIVPDLPKGPLFLKGEVAPTKGPKFLTDVQKEIIEKAKAVPKRTPKQKESEYLASRKQKIFPGEKEEDAEIVQHIYEFSKDRIDARRRMEQRPWTKVDEEALEMVKNRERMDKLKRREIATFSDSEIKALEFESAHKIEKLKNNMKKLSKSPESDVDNAQFYLDFMDTTKTLETYWAGYSEAGRTLATGRKKPMEFKSLDAIFKAAGGRDQLLKWNRDMMDAFSKLDLTDIGAVNAFMKSVPKPQFSNKDKIFFAVMNGWLSGIPTHMRNVASNTVFLASKMAETGVAGPVDVMLSQVSGKRAIYSKEVGPQALGAIHGLGYGIPNAFRHLKNILTLKPVEASVTKLEERFNPIGGTLGEVVAAPVKALTAEDEFFKAVAGSMEHYSLAFNDAWSKGLRGKAFRKRVDKLLQRPPRKMKSAIEQEKLYRTYQQALEGWGNLFFKARENIPFARYILPFIRTPGNLLKAAIERSPGLSVGRIGYRAARGAYKGWTTDPEVQRQLSLELSRSIVGHLIGGWYVTKFLEGRVTGPMPRSAAEREVWYMNNIQPHSLRLNDGTYIPIPQIVQEPYGVMLTTMLDTIAYAMEDGRDLTADEVASIAQNFANNFLERSFLRGLYDFTQAITNAESKAGKYWTSVPTWFIPYSSMMGSMARATDVYFRKPETVTEKIKARLPGLSKEVRPKLSVLGELQERPGTAFERFAMPFAITKESDDPVKRELLRLQKEKDFVISYPSKSLAKGVQLDSDEFNRLLYQQGQIIKTTLSNMFNSKEYMDAASDDVRIDMIEMATRLIRRPIRQKAKARKYVEMVKERMEQ